jgi:hypothetical protein
MVTVTTSGTGRDRDHVALVDGHCDIGRVRLRSRRLRDGDRAFGVARHALRISSRKYVARLTSAT